MLHISVINPVKQRVNCMALVVTEKISLAKRQTRHLAFSLSLSSHLTRFFSLSLDESPRLHDSVSVNFSFLTDLLTMQFERNFIYQV